nr:spexin isoform X1 [Equus caballus]
MKLGTGADLDHERPAAAAAVAPLPAWGLAVPSGWCHPDRPGRAGAEPRVSPLQRAAASSQTRAGGRTSPTGRRPILLQSNNCLYTWEDGSLSHLIVGSDKRGSSPGAVQDHISTFLPRHPIFISEGKTKPKLPTTDSSRGGSSVTGFLAETTRSWRRKF